MKHFNVGHSGNSSLYLLQLKNLSIAICKLGRRQICPHTNLNGTLAIMQMFEEGEDRKSVIYRIDALPIITWF